MSGNGSVKDWVLCPHAMHGSWYKVGAQLGVSFLPLTRISGMAVPDVPRPLSEEAGGPI